MNNEKDLKRFIKEVRKNNMEWDYFRKNLLKSSQETWPKSSLVLLINELEVISTKIKYLL